MGAVVFAGQNLMGRNLQKLNSKGIFTRETEEFGHK